MLKMVCFVVFIDNIQYHPIIHISHYPLIRPIGWSGDGGGGNKYVVGVGVGGAEGGHPSHPALYEVWVGSIYPPPPPLQTCTSHSLPTYLMILV